VLEPYGFSTLADALDLAARGPTGFNIYSQRGEVAEVLPYAELRGQARALAARFISGGFKPGDRVALAAVTDGDFLRAFFACQYAGLAPAPLPLPAPFGGKEAYIEHVRNMLRASGAKAAVAPEDLVEWFTEAAQGLDVEFVGTIADLPEASEIVLPQPDPEGLCYIQFSSGSTRSPSGVAVTQSALLANGRIAMGEVAGAKAFDRALSWLPLYHDMGLVGFVLMPIIFQMSVDLLPTAAFVRRPLLWLELISRNRATFSYSPTFGYELAARRCDAAALAKLDLSCWRVAGVGGDMVRPNVLRTFAETFGPAGFDGSGLTVSYGMAEATLALTYEPGLGLHTDVVDKDRLEHDAIAETVADKTERTREFAICGRMLPHHEAEIRDGHGRPLPDRAVGRIFVRGPSLMRGYFGEPEATARVLSPEGWLDTGDLGYFIDGQLVVTGRAKDLMIVNGRNIWPQDLEWSVEHAIAGLRSGDVAVFSIQSEMDERVVAFVQVRNSDAAARQQMRVEIRKHLLSRHGVDVEVVLTPPHSLPQTSSGKLSRSRAKAMYKAGAFAPAPASLTA
jgi:fatty-acyl-CoA synthase